eukprot:6576599-Alexandrium_andersonii.AAC.1
MRLRPPRHGCPSMVSRSLGYTRNVPGGVATAHARHWNQAQACSTYACTSTRERSRAATGAGTCPACSGSGGPGTGFKR